MENPTTGNRSDKHSESHKASLLLTAIVAVFAIAAFFLTHTETASQSASPVSGLMTLKTTAQAATPYTVALNNQKPTLVEFYADWCTTCQAMAPVLRSLHQQFGNQINFVMLNIDDPQWGEQVQQFQVRGVPHLTLLHADQTIADTLIGEVPKRILSDRVMSLLG